MSFLSLIIGLMDARRGWTHFDWWTPDRVARLAAAAVFGLAVVLLLMPATAPYPSRAAAQGPNLLEEIFDNLASIILIRVTLAAVVAFVSGAFVQRLLLADFAVKVGPAGIELGEVSRTSAMSVERLSKSIEDLAVQTRAKTDDLGAILRELRDSVRALRDHIE